MYMDMDCDSCVFNYNEYVEPYGECPVCHLHNVEAHPDEIKFCHDWSDGAGWNDNKK